MLLALAGTIIRGGQNQLCRTYNIEPHAYNGS